MLNADCSRCSNSCPLPPRLATNTEKAQRNPISSSSWQKSTALMRPCEPQLLHSVHPPNSESYCFGVWSHRSPFYLCFLNSNLGLLLSSNWTWTIFLNSISNQLQHFAFTHTTQISGTYFSITTFLLVLQSYFCTIFTMIDQHAFRLTTIDQIISQ